MSITDTAKQVGLCTRAVSNRLRKPRVIAMLAAARQEAISVALRGFVRSLEGSRKLLEEIRDNPALDPRLRLRAAQALIQGSQQVADLQADTLRDSTLEARAAEQSPL